MNLHGQWVWILALAAGGTWLERVGPWFLMTRLGPRLDKYSRYSAVWVENFVPAIVVILWIRAIPLTHRFDMILWVQVLGASVLTMVVARMTNSLAFTVLSGMAAYWVLSFIR